MTSVNPPPLKVPKAFLKDPEVNGAYSALLTVVRQLWARTGGPTGDLGGTISLDIGVDPSNSVGLNALGQAQDAQILINVLNNQIQQITLAELAPRYEWVGADLDLSLRYENSVPNFDLGQSQP